MNSFSFSGQIPRVIFGPGSLQYLSREIDLIGAQRALILCTPGQRAGAELVADLIGVRCAGIFDRAVMHVPLDIAGEVRDVALQVNADCVIAIGGGSTTGLGKAIALVSTLPILAIPTTYAGSEMTPIYGITDNGVKKTGRDVRVLPKTVIYDPELTVDLPASLSITSGINAIAHAAECMYAQDANPIMSFFAEEGMRALVRGLPKIVSQLKCLEGRSDCLYGAWLCGVVLGNVGMGLHHKLCHTLGGSFRLPHAETHTIILPHVLAYNRDAAPDAMHRISIILGAPDAAQGMFDFAQSLAAPTALKDIGMQESDLDLCAKIATQDAYPNPRSMGTKEVRALLENAYWGNRP
ncbi:maleylacetate reductase [Undibacterium arcticum]|uniref:Maleylacetate reductase n=1 Tax=Undibacterium arcticum TaxID=1762892 RepID=A0ABV7EXL8_9BURK